MSKSQGWNQSVSYAETEDKKSTIESRMNDLKYAVSDISGLASHIYGTLFGFEPACGEPLADEPPSINNTLQDVERHVREASEVLQSVYEGLTNAERLKIKP